MNNELVTIAIPTRNRAKYLEATIDSVRRQTYQNLDIVISDNCSEDSTEDLVRGVDDSRIRYFRQDHNLGMVGNWNFCLGKAEGRYFLLLSDDDLMEPSAIASLLSSFADQSVQVSYSLVRYIDGDSNPRGVSPSSPEAESYQEFVSSSLAGHRVVMPSATLVRTEVAKRIGGFPDIGTASDLAFRLTASLGGTVKCVSQPLVMYRVHDLALSASQQAVIDSHAAFAGWANRPGCSLYQYRDSVRSFCVRIIYQIGLSEALRAHADTARVARTVLANLGAPAVYQAVLRLASLPVLRMAADLRRRLLRRGAVS